MKKLLIYLLCLTIFLQSGVSAYAVEITETTEENQLEEEKDVEQEEDEIAEEPETDRIENETVEESEADQIEGETAEESETEQTEKTKTEEQEAESEIEEVSVEEVSGEPESEETIEDEDPQYGRENGFLDEGFVGLETFSTSEKGYTHAAKFDGYTVNDVIDVSKFQGTIDWKEVKKSGIDYAFIRVGFRGYGESGSLNVDTYYAENLSGAIKAGLKVGVYFFSQAITTEEATEEAEYVLNLIEGYDISLPVVIDFEYASAADGLTGRLYNANLSKSTATKICKKFCAVVEKNGYTAMVYANKNMLENDLNASEIAKEYGVWLANYATSVSYEGEYDIWQYTQNGTVDGISGKVDKNFWYVEPEEPEIVIDTGHNVEIDDTLVNRIYGANRYSTCLAIAEAYKQELGVDKFDNVIIATGTEFADALSGSYLSYVKKAPILITNQKYMASVKAYIKNNLNQGGTIYVLGSTVAVPNEISTGLSDYTIKRLEGPSRYETNIAILKEANVTDEDILVCTGMEYADCLAAAATKKPILLVKNTLRDAQKEYLASLSGNKFYIIGSEAAVNTSIEAEIQAYGNTERIGGRTRHETSVLIAETFFENPTSIVLAYSYNFPDGLCGGPLAMSMNAPIILAQPGRETTAKEYAETYGIHKGSVLGSSSLIDDDTVRKILGRISEIEAEAELVAHTDGEVELIYETFVNEKSSADNNYYLIQTDSYSGKMIGSPIAIVEKNIEISIRVDNLEQERLKELIMNELVLAVKTESGTYEAINEPVGIRNPEAIASNTTEIFKASSKKGLQGINHADDGREVTDARYSNTKQTLFNLDLASVVGEKAGDGYVEYTYRGNTYCFSDCSALRSSIQTLNAGYEQYLYGNSDTTKVSVSLCLLLSYNTKNSYLIDPAARTYGHSYYMLNVREEKSRETLEALFLYLGEIFGQEDCYVTNWILGNEVNSSHSWNYSGNLQFDTYIECYAKAFKMLYNGVKAEKTGNTVSISLDNGWTAVPDTYSGKKTLDAFAEKINQENSNIEWSIAYHAYSYPLTRADFWNDSQNTTDSVSTKYISMKNIHVLTDYVAELEDTYKMDSGSIRVLLTEQGYSASAGSYTQAEALARGYYAAEFNDRIDAFIIRAVKDDPDEIKGGLYLGLMDSQDDKRIAFYTYEYMDSDLSEFYKTSAQETVSAVNYSDFNNAKKILCNTNWESMIPGFDESKLAAMK